VGPCLNDRGLYLNLLLPYLYHIIDNSWALDGLVTEMVPLRTRLSVGTGVLDLQMKRLDNATNRQVVSMLHRYLHIAMLWIYRQLPRDVHKFPPTSATTPASFLYQKHLRPQRRPHRLRLEDLSLNNFAMRWEQSRSTLFAPNWIRLIYNQSV